ncbi:Spy/CpxP family protein refolding chaperone [Chamaesiphon sp. OTE_75_metabat_556]|jgi:periplasmic protein CpxP/Spy|uniref:Spy/CpxP family protein refolding chaperone n=1 Tax=Chamaesiphon sp. OTE_75_metabat_556 TaxID=2964692 RepID=UPI00286A2C5F|nr:Spy/CpxP family protein refolding chaperone [Chamaesiphon sp. OTE_75_metabat_556]
MSRFRLLTLLSTLLAFATLGSPVRAERALAQTSNRPATGQLQVPAGGVLNLVKELNLSRDQIQRLQQLRKNAQGQNKERRQALQIARQELAQLIQGNGSSAQIRQKRQQVQSLQREIADTNFENTLAIREILTPEQRVKLQQVLEQRRQNRLNSK